MTWIRTIPPEEADARLQAVFREQQASYPPEYATAIPGLSGRDADGIVAAHSRIPEGLHHAFATFAACMAPDLPLTRRQHEIIATVVSAANRTRYCSVSHAAFLREVTHDDRLSGALARDPATAPLTDAERVMVDYALQVTRDATAISPADHARLRAVGFDDRGILQITMIAAWFNYINRVADALGVGREAPPGASGAGA